MSKGSKGTGKFVLGAAIGAAVGAIAGILTAPKSGKETRTDIKEKACEAKDIAGEKVEEGKKAVKSLKGKVSARDKKDKSGKA